MYNEYMKLFIFCLVVFFVYRWVRKWVNNINLFLEHYEIAIIDKEDVERGVDESKDILSLRPETYENSMDLRGTPTHICPCGSQIWNLKVIFEDFEIGTYFLDMECVSCGSVATAPTPVDRMETEE
jgi:hypothetical protein